MVDHSAVIERINANETRGTWLLWLGYPLALVLAVAWPQWGILTGIGLVVICHTLRNWLPSRSPVQFDYQLDDEERRKYEGLRNAVSWLAQCHRLWQVNAFENTTDWKRNAGANQLIQRSPAAITWGSARSFTANVDVAALRVKRETLYFLPDMILIHQAGRFGSVAYSGLEVANSKTNFTESEAVPRDAETVGSTWRFVNKHGGPDRRFTNNRQMPVVRYGEVILRSPTGLRLALMTSSHAAADTFAGGIRYVQSFVNIPVSYSLAQPEPSPAPTVTASPKTP